MDLAKPTSATLTSIGSATAWAIIDGVLGTLAALIAIVAGLLGLYWGYRTYRVRYDAARLERQRAELELREVQGRREAQRKQGG